MEQLIKEVIVVDDYYSQDVNGILEVISNEGTKTLGTKTLF